MDKGWRELESDPGLFTLLVEDIGVEGVQVEEIYDLTKPIEGTVYGYVFLFKWIEERRARRKLQQEEDHFVMDEDTVNSMFFAQQVITNSCATHALLSILMNCPQVKLGLVLAKLKEFSKFMNPEDKGHAIGNVPELAKAHNSHARPEAPRKLEKQPQVLSTTARTIEAFHFVSYLPINNRLYELDGLKPCPIDHGPLDPGEEWTDKFHRVITKRIGVTAGEEPCHDIRYNLMALVPDKRGQYDTKLNTLKTNRRIVLEALQQMVKVTSPEVGLTRTKEPIMTRSVAREAREALANHHAEEKKKSRRGGPAEEDPSNISQNSILNCHSYAKSPMMDDMTDVTAMDCEDEFGHEKVASSLNESQNQDDPGSNIKLSPEGQDGLAEDFNYPLTIDTKFPPGSPGRDSESTDTASEVCSLLNSPDSSTTSANSSPSTSFLKQLASKAELQVSSDKLEIGQEALLRVKAQLEGTASGSLFAGLGLEDLTDLKDDKSPKGGKTKLGGQGFTPKDLLALLKNVEQEIAVTEQLLRDEKEKRRKYRVDDCRRTHNYDQFFCTFLSMLAEQGLLSDLMEKSIYKKKARTNDVKKIKTLQKIKQNQKKRPRGKKKK